VNSEEMKKVIEFIKKYPEVLTITGLLVLWRLSSSIFRFFDPTSGVFDLGVFQIIIFAGIQFSVYVSFAWLVMKLLYGTLRRYLQSDFKKDFEKLDKWQKIKLAFGVFFALVFLLAYLSRTI